MYTLDPKLEEYLKQNDYRILIYDDLSCAIQDRKNERVHTFGSPDGLTTFIQNLPKIVTLKIKAQIDKEKLITRIKNIAGILEVKDA